MGHLFKSKAAVVGLMLGVVTSSPAAAGVSTYGSDLRFVTETAIPSSGDGEVISLCHLVDYMQVLSVPVYTKIEGYALASDGCTTGSYRPLTSENLATLQEAGFIDASVPAVPKASFVERVWGHAWLVLMAAGLLVRGLSMLPWRHKPRAARPDTLAIHSLVAMAQVAVADGQIDDREIRQISGILTRLTGQSYTMEQVADLLQRLAPSARDLEQIGQNLSAADRQIVLEAALNIAVADGEIHPSEYAVVSDLAQRMRIGADAFRKALSRIAAHLKTVQPV